MTQTQDKHTPIDMPKRHDSRCLRLPGAARLVAVLLALCAAVPAARAAVADSLQWNVSLTATASGGRNTPFWLVSNRQGLANVEKDFGYARLALSLPEQRSGHWRWEGGADIALGWRMQSTLTVQQLWAGAGYRCLGAWVGCRELPDIFGDKALSSGNLLFSGNARPLPQVRLGIFDYADIWGLRGWLAIKGYLAFGAFTDSAWQRSWWAEGQKRSEHVLYHSKGVWLRNGNPDVFPLTLECGLEMGTQFGGIIYKGDEVWHMPKNLKAWWKALVPKGGESTTPTEEQTNVQGNMTGCWDFRLAWTPKEADWAVKAYYEHYFEDHSQLYVEYAWKDGLWGVEGQLPANPFVDKVVYEYLYTKDQTGAVYWDHNDAITEQVSGRDNYYNHYLYSGWQHWGMGMGNPLVLSPIWNAGRESYFRSTRVEGHHFGVSGSPLPTLGWRVLASVTRNWGNYAATEYGGPLDKVETTCSLLAEVTWRPASRSLRGWEATLGIAGDTGGLTGRNLGMMLTIGKRGWWNFTSKRKQ